MAPFTPPDRLPALLRRLRRIDDEEDVFVALTVLDLFRRENRPTDLAKSVSLVAAIAAKQNHGQPLLALAPHLDAALISVAIAGARRIADAGQRLTSLCHLAAAHPQPRFRRSVLTQVARRARGDWLLSQRVLALGMLSQAAPDAATANSILTKALNAVWSNSLVIYVADAHAPLTVEVSALHVLEPYLPDQVLHDTITRIRSLPDAQFQADLITELDERLAQCRTVPVEHCWTDVRDKLAAARSRRAVIRVVIEHACCIHAVGSEQAVLNCQAALRDVYRWWLDEADLDPPVTPQRHLGPDKVTGGMG